MVGAGIMIPPIGSLLVTISRSFHSFHLALGPGEIFCLFWPVHLLSWNSYFIANFLSLPSISHHHPQIFFQISSSLCSCTFYICSVLYHPFLHNATSSSFEDLGLGSIINKHPSLCQGWRIWCPAVEICTQGTSGREW